jgi:hypothetical protein
MSGGQRIDLKVTEIYEFWAYLCLFGPVGDLSQLFLFVSDVQCLQKIWWLNKMKQRWNNAPTVENWEYVLTENKRTAIKCYLKMRGMIALTYVIVNCFQEG